MWFIPCSLATGNLHKVKIKFINYALLCEINFQYGEKTNNLYLSLTNNHCSGSIFKLITKISFTNKQITISLNIFIMQVPYPYSPFTHYPVIYELWH